MENPTQKEKVKMPKINNQTLIDYINCKDYKNAIEFADEFGKYLASNGFASTKLRNVFGEIDNILYTNKAKADKNIIKKRVALLKPKLAYLVGRENRWNREVVNNFKKILEIMIDELLSKDDLKEEKYKHFVNFVKAVVSYHKYHGGN